MIVKLVSETEEIVGIKELQNRNLKSRLKAEEIQKEGFVTAEYTLDFLKEMNQYEPSVIVKEGEDVIGYALMVNRNLYGKHELMDDLIDQIDQLTFAGEKLSDINYAIVGQLCVDKAFRGQSLVSKMYDYYREQYSGKYKYLITDVDDLNPRSFRAHIKEGFEIIGTLKYGGSSWKIVLWNWRA